MRDSPVRHGVIVSLCLASFTGAAHRDCFAGSKPDSPDPVVQPEIELEDGEVTTLLGEEREEQKLENLYYINGINTNGSLAIGQATALANTLQSQGKLIFNELSFDDETIFDAIGNGLAHGISLAVEKLGDADISLNEATASVMKQVEAHIIKGESVNLVAYSAGTLCVNNAIRSLAEGWDDDGLSEEQITERLSKIHILFVGSALLAEDSDFADKLPSGLGSVHTLIDERDPVSDVFGGGEYDDDSDERYHDFLGHYLGKISPEMLIKSGWTVLRAEEESRK